MITTPSRTRAGRAPTVSNRFTYLLKEAYGHQSSGSLQWVGRLVPFRVVFSSNDVQVVTG